MKWLRKHIGDFSISTASLTLAEVGALNRLLDVYYGCDGALENDKQVIYRAARAVSDEDKKIVDYISARYFYVAEDGRLHNRRADMEMARNPDPESNRVRSVPEGWETTRRAVFERDDYTCRYCGIETHNPECDHVVPVTRGGSHGMDNLATACTPCNRSKGNKLLSEWKR